MLSSERPTCLRTWGTYWRIAFIVKYQGVRMRTSTYSVWASRLTIECWGKEVHDILPTETN